MPLISFVSLSAFSTPKVVVWEAWGLDSTGTILNQKEIGFGRWISLLSFLLEELFLTLSQRSPAGLDPWPTAVTHPLMHTLLVFYCFLSHPFLKFLGIIFKISVFPQNCFIRICFWENSAQSIQLSLEPTAHWHDLLLPLPPVNMWGLESVWARSLSRPLCSIWEKGYENSTLKWVCMFLDDEYTCEFLNIRYNR